MKIYIEQALITNLIIDACILIVVAKIVSSTVNIKRVVLAALFGSVASLVVPFCHNTILTNMLKILTSIIMLQILHIHKKQLAASMLMMLALSYIIGGALLSNFGTASSNGYIISPQGLIPVFATTLIFTFISCKLIHWIKSKITTNCNIYDIVLTYNCNSVKIKSFIDTGNTLYDNNQPVSLINFDTFNKLTKISLDQYLANNFNTLNNAHFIEANTVAGTKKILVFTINELRINKGHAKTYTNVCLGVALNFDNSKEYKAILNSSFCFN